MTSTDFSGGRKTYRVSSPLKLLTPVILALVFTFVLLAVVSKPDERAFLPYLGIIFVIVLGIVYWFMSLTRLDVSSDGIIYYSVGYRVRSTWPNVQGYGKRVMGSHDVDCLILRESGLEMSRWMQIGLILQPVGRVAGALQGRYIGSVRMDNYAVWIPVGMYAEDWRNGELGEYVRRYAPEAFDNPV